MTLHSKDAPLHDNSRIAGYSETIVRSYLAEKLAFCLLVRSEIAEEKRAYQAVLGRRESGRMPGAAGRGSGFQRRPPRKRRARSAPVFPQNEETIVAESRGGSSAAGLW